ncbi:hypothetical protein GUITHDRAFT_161770 [Guillardia theta CCMP2712]|uniref:Prefoldin subunit 6 n=1 Tax=Guillardia theta (strain CCMP2712) TaxID=905079 RepID=L1JRS3_GUITC|nr:hypothetical protein GUITHDRAFT_161770 [Guillardia theta CCMP2712]EKX51004.1 hypothetical protein GUITHDRAFT_161770 [Guillardia theta CCMP2712]|eukprot:XP_005837984.1 hypothetical protein GUITHDRAFT_161770 [Guillardia theta CCMP2712]
MMESAGSQGMRLGMRVMIEQGDEGNRSERREEMAVQQRLEVEAKAYQSLQQEHAKMGQTYSKLLAQQNENNMVLDELKLIDGGAVYKLVGPVLLSQDPEEAKSNVEKRLQYIGDEMKRTQNHVIDLEKKMEEKRNKLQQLQAQLKQGQSK